MLCKKHKEDNRKAIFKDVGVMKLTQKFLELRCKMWVLISMSLTLMLQCITQCH